MKKIALLMAMQSEAQPLLSSLGMAESCSLLHPQLPFKQYQGEFGPFTLMLVTSGKDVQHKVDNVGTIPASLMAAKALDIFTPDLVINAGTAGGFVNCGCKIGDVYLSSDYFCFHDRRIPLPGFEQYGRGSYPSFDTRRMAEVLQLKRGAVSTGDSLDFVARDLELIKENGATVKDMEAAAIAWVCKAYQIDMFAIKAVTDLVDGEDTTAGQFMKNLHLASVNLQQSVLRVLNFLEQRFQ